MIYLLDTNAISDLVRKHPLVERRVEAARASTFVATTVIAIGEVLQGIERLQPGLKRQTLSAQIAAIRLVVPTEPTPIAAAEEYARIKTERQLAGRPMDTNDLWIAATTVTLGAVLVSRDSDFAGVSGLIVEDWSS